MSLTLSEAQAISVRVREHATELGARVTVAIVDGGGHLQVLDRMDGAPPLRCRLGLLRRKRPALRCSIVTAVS